MHETSSLGGSESHILTLGAAPLASVVISPGDLVVSGIELGVGACTAAAVADSSLLGAVEMSRHGRKSQITNFSLWQLAISIH